MVYCMSKKASPCMVCLSKKASPVFVTAWSILVAGCLCAATKPQGDWCKPVHGRRTPVLPNQNEFLPVLRHFDDNSMMRLSKACRYPFKACICQKGQFWTHHSPASGRSCFPFLAFAEAVRFLAAGTGLHVLAAVVLITGLLNEGILT